MRAIYRLAFPIRACQELGNFLMDDFDEDEESVEADEGDENEDDVDAGDSSERGRRTSELRKKVDRKPPHRAL